MNFYGGIRAVGLFLSGIGVVGILTGSFLALMVAWGPIAGVIVLALVVLAIIFFIGASIA